MLREELQRKLEDACIPMLKTVVEQHEHALEEVSCKLCNMAEVFSMGTASAALGSSILDIRQEKPSQREPFTPPRSGVTSSTASMSQESSAQRLLSTPLCGSSIYSSP